MELFKLFGSILINSDEADKSLAAIDKKAEGAGGKLDKLGGVALAVGGVLTGALAAGIGAVATGMGGLFVAGNNLQQALNGLKAQTGATQEEMASMEDSLKTIYTNNYGESFEDIANTMAIAKQSTTAFGEELMYLTQDALMLRDTFGLDVSESLRGAETMMEQFGATGTEAMAYIAEATQKGLNQNDDLVDTIEEYSVYFKTAGLDAKDMFGILENASKAGVRNLDYVGDAFKEMVIRTKDGSKSTTEAYQALGLNAKQMMDDFAAGGDRGKQAYQTMMEALNAIEDPVKRNTVGVQLFGTKFEDLEAGAVEAMSNLTGTITGSVDTLNEINEIKYDSFGEALKGIGRNVMMGIFEPFQEKVMPIVNEFANWMVEKMPVVQETASTTFSAVFDVVEKVWIFFKDNILPIFSEVFSNVQANFPVIKSTFQTVFTAVWEVLKTVWGFLKDNVIPIFTSLFTWVQGHMPTIRATISTVFNKIVEVASMVWAFFKDNILPILARLLEFIQSKMPQIQRIVENVFNIIANVVKIAWDVFENLLLPVLKALWDYIVAPAFSKVQTIIEKVFGAIFTVVDKVVGVFDDVVSAIKDAIDWLTFWDNKKVSKKTIEVEEKRKTSNSSYDKNATGTNYFQGGTTLVGERGPEIVTLPRGTKIDPANETRNKLSSGGGNTYNFYPQKAIIDEKEVVRSIQRLEVLYG